MVARLLNLEDSHGNKIRVSTHVRDASLPGNPLVDNPRLARLKDRGFRLATQKPAASASPEKDSKPDQDKAGKKKN